MVRLKNTSGQYLSISGIGHFRPGDVMQFNVGAKGKFITGKTLQGLPNGRTLVEMDPVMTDDTAYDRLYEPQIKRVTEYLKEKESIGLLEQVQQRIDPPSTYVRLTIYGIRLKIWYEVIAQEVKRFANVAMSTIYWEDEESPDAVCKVHIYIGEER